jgi:3-oxoacyl-[acyl-carrier protein] reductase
VHNAGITRDKTLANMTPEYWDAVLAVNLKAPQVLTKALLDSGTLHDNAAGAAGLDQRHRRQPRANQLRGEQGRADRLGPGLGATAQGARHQHQRRGAGFIETQMTAHIPFGLREAGRRMSSWARAACRRTSPKPWPGGQPGSGAVSGQALRVCGQSLWGVSMHWHTLDATPSLPPLYWRAMLKRKISGSTLPAHGLRCG